jgi:hypothetical protein
MNSRQGIAYVPGLIAALCCVLLVQFRFLGFLYLLPLGIMAAGYNFRTAWFCLVMAAIGNGIWSAGVGAVARYPWDQTLWGIAHFSLTSAAFTWVMAPSPGGVSEYTGENPPARVPTVYRFLAASGLTALLLLPVALSLRNDTGFNAAIRAQIEALTSVYTSAAGADVVEKSLLERYLTPEALLETAIFVALRGGAVASCMVFLFINRQAALVLVRFFRRIRSGNSLSAFHAPYVFIWVLSFSILTVLVGMKWKIAPLEIVAWNGLVICAMLYLVQGGGIAAHFLRRAGLPPFVRLLLSFLLIVLFFSPGINTLLLGGLVLLGIVENWVPFRAPKINGPSSTPGM